jgi:hypothetical protein
MNEESLFAAALDKATAAERRAFLDGACGGDAALRQRLEQLLPSRRIAEEGPGRWVLQKRGPAGPHESQ